MFDLSSLFAFLRCSQLGMMRLAERFTAASHGQTAMRRQQHRTAWRVLELATCAGLVLGSKMSLAAGTHATEASAVQRAAGMPVSTVKRANVAESVTALPLTLPQTLSLVLLRNPQLAAFSREVRAREATQLQAGLLPNPEFATTAENFGNKRLQGFDGAATTWQLSQRLELGGKRYMRMRLAGLERDLAAWDYETKRLDVLTATRQAFYQVLAAQQRETIAHDLADLAAQLYDTVAGRVRAGKVAPLEQTKATVATKAANLQLNRTRSEHRSARISLAALWAAGPDDFSRLSGELEHLSDVPDFTLIAGATQNNPDIARWVTELEQRQAALKSAEVARIPDLTLNAGFRQYWNNGDGALVTGVSLPLPLFDRNQGNIRAAAERLAKAENEQRAAEVATRSALERTYRSLAATHMEATTLRRDILPSAQSAFTAASAGYRQGKFNYLDVLDAQRTYFETKIQYLSVLANYHALVAELERLLGTSLQEIKNKS